MEITLKIIRLRNQECYGIIVKNGTLGVSFRNSYRIEVSSMKTIFDVAELAGVSKSTVSRVINGTGSIKESTRKKVEKAMAELNYSPSYLAQGIRTGKTKTIALVVCEASNLYYNELLYRIEAIARQQGYMVLFCNAGNDPARSLEYTIWLRQRVDGILYCFYRDSQEADELYRLAAEMPVVFLDNPLGNRTNVSYVGADGLEDMAEIVRHFKNVGATSIGFIGIGEISNISYRYMGYRAGLAACGYSLDPELVCMADFSQIDSSHFTLGYEAAKKLMNGNRKPDAIIAATDMLAIGALRYLLEAGYDVPGQVALTGYDNILLSTMTTPTLSTVSQPLEQIAEEAMSILIHKIQKDNGYNRSALLRSTLIQRDSTK